VLRRRNFQQPPAVGFTFLSHGYHRFFSQVKPPMSTQQLLGTRCALLTGARKRIKVKLLASLGARLSRRLRNAHRELQAMSR
jgi:hypothetical protein